MRATVGPIFPPAPRIATSPGHSWSARMTPGRRPRQGLVEFRLVAGCVLARVHCWLTGARSGSAGRCNVRVAESDATVRLVAERLGGGARRIGTGRSTVPPRARRRCRQRRGSRRLVASSTAIRYGPLRLSRIVMLIAVRWVPGWLPTVRYWADRLNASSRRDRRSDPRFPWSSSLTPARRLTRAQLIV